MTRVTEIIERAGLMDGSEWFQPKHRTRGKLVHAACHMIAQGRSDELEAWYQRASGDPHLRGDMLRDNFVKHEDCRPFIEGARLWLVKSGFKVQHVEYEVRHVRLDIVGHIDWLGFFEHAPGTWWIIDLKNGAQEKWHRLQTGGYRSLLFSEHGTLARRGALYLPDGKLIPHDDRMDGDKFLALAQAQQVVQEFRK